MTWVWRNPLPQGNDLTSCAGTSDGIGLAVVRDLVEEVYYGRLEIGQGELGGARVRARLRFQANGG